MSFKMFDATPRVFDAFLFLFNTLLLNSSKSDQLFSSQMFANVHIGLDEEESMKHVWILSNLFPDYDILV